MIRCLVVDDEPLALDILADYISKVQYLELVKATTSAFEGLRLVQENQVDLVFLDVQMPELNGMQFLKIINGKCPVILTTAYPEYALEGYDLSVSDYLLKPIAFDRFYKAVQKIKVVPGGPRVTADTARSLKGPEDFIFVKTEHKIQKIYVGDILYIEGLKDYISIFTPSGRVITLQNMKKMEDALPSGQFIRVHKSYIIALDKIESIERSRIFIGDKVIPVGDTYRDSFFRAIEDKNI